MTSTARRLTLLAFVCFAAVGESAVAAPLTTFEIPPGCTIAWDGGAGTARWHDAANWDTDIAPGPADRVCIPATAPGGAVVLGDAAPTTVAALHSEKPVTVAAGQLTLTGASAVDVLRLTGGVVAASDLTVASELVQTGGELTGGGSVAVQGVMVWTAGVQSGSGFTDLAGSGGLQLAGDGTRTIRGERLVSSATDVTWAGEGTVVLENGHLQALRDFISTSALAAVTGTGAVHVTERLLVNGVLDLSVALDAASATAVVDGPGAQLALRAGGEHVLSFDLRDGGSIFLDGAAHTLVGDVQSTTGGGVVANADVTVEGAYAVGATTVNTGTLRVPANARLGRTRVNGGTVELLGDAEAETVEQSAGEVRGTGTLGVDGPFTWSGGLQSGAGVTEVRASELRLTGEGVRTLGDDRLLTAAGVAWTGGGSISLEGGTLQSMGAFVANGTSAQLSGSGTLMLGDELLVDGVYLGLGVDLQAGSASVRVRGESGRLALSAGEHITSFRLEQDGSLLVRPGVHTFAGPITGGSGALIAEGDVTLEQELAVDRISMIGGRLKLPAQTTVRKLSLWDGIVETSAATTLAELQQESGELRGAGALTITGTFSWLGGIQSGPGETVVGGDAGTLELLGAGTRTLDRVLRVQREARLGRGATLSTAEGAALVVAGDLIADDGSAFVEGDGGVLVDGSLRVHGVELGLASELEMRPGSSLEVSGENGLLTLAGNGFYEGSVAVDTGGHLELIGGAHTFDVESEVDAMAGGYVSTDEQAELYIRGKFDADDLWTFGAKTVIDAPIVNVTRMLTHNELDIQPGASLVTHEKFENLEGTVILRGTGAVLEGRGELENLESGTIQGLGTIRGRLVNRGRLEPGFEAQHGTLRIDGVLELTDSSVVEVHGTAAAHDELAVTGQAFLDGLITVLLADDVDELTVVRPFARTGEFDGSAGSGCATVRYDGAHVIASNLPCVHVADGQVRESDGKLRFPVTVSRSSGQTVSLTWEAEAGSATAGEDFPASNGVLILADGQTSSAIELPVIDDDEEEEQAETLTLRLTGAEGARLRTSEVTGTILDDDGDNAEGDIWYKPRDIGLVGMEMTPTAMNYRSVVGYTENQVDWTYWKFGWGYRIDLDQLSSLTALGAALDLNRHGTIVGNTDFDEESASKPVLRRNVTGVAELPPVPGYHSAYAYGLNDDEWVVGEASLPPAGDAPGGWDAIMWKPDGSTVVLDSPGSGGFAQGVDVNNKGQAIGYSSRGSGRVAWIWENGTLHELGSLGTNTTPSRLNEHGEVVGSFGTGQVGHGFVWKPGLGLLDLGVGFAEDINEKHEIVGFSEGLGATLWKEDGQKINLNSLLPPNSGWFLTVANAINDDGKIAGVGYHNGRRAVFVLEPFDCKVCVDDVKTEHLTYSTSSFVETERTTDGNQVRISAKVVNETSEAKDVAIRIVDAETDEVLGEEIEGFRLEPGASRDIETTWDTTGSAWRGESPRRARTIRIEAVTPDGEPLDDVEKELAIAPRPVVLVHGLWSDASTWGIYTQLLQSVNPDWYGFAVGTLDTSSGTIAANAAEVAQAVENVRVAREAWRVDLVAHSTGGLIARRYVHELMPTLADGTPAVTNLVMVGTPNHGSPCADLLPLESTFEMRTDVVRGFNAAITERRGVHFSVAAGNRTHVTCDVPLPGDDVVPVASAQTGYDDTATFHVAHVAMTNSDALFHQFVKPHLAQGPSGAAAFATGFAPAAFAAEADALERPQPQLLESRTLTIAAGASAELPLDGGSGTAVGAVLAAPGTVRVTLFDAFGDPVSTIEPSGEPGLAFRTVRGSTDFASDFTLVVENEGAQEVQVPLSAWIEEPSSRLAATAEQSSAAGRVRVTAQVVGSSARPSITAQVTRGGTQPIALTLLDDGLSNDGLKGDGVYSNRTAALEDGDYTVLVRAASPFNRLTTAAVRVKRAEPLPPNAPPVPATPPVQVKANGTVTFTLAATDADDDTLEIVRSGNPAHGFVSGTGRTLTYTPHTDYVGPDTLPYRISDGINAPVFANVEITVTRRPSLLSYQGPTEAREGTTINLKTILIDAQVTGRTLSGEPVTYELDGQPLSVERGGFGIYSSPVELGAGLKTMTLVARFPGNALFLPTETTVQIAVKANRAPQVAPGVNLIEGEAGYTTRFFASPSDPDGNLTTIEFDYTDDGVYDASYAYGDAFAEWITTYPEAFEGNARVRVTDRLGLQATATLAMKIAPHRPLGPLSRILVDGRRVDGGRTSDDGRFVLFDHKRNDFPPTGRPDELHLLDRETGQHEPVGIFPDGQLARDVSSLAEFARISATGRWVAFPLTTKAWPSDPGIQGQVYLRDRETQTTEIVSVNSAGQLANGHSMPVAISPDGRLVLLQSRATNLDPRTTLACSGCENLFLRDRETGTTEIVSLGHDGKPVGNQWLTGGMSADGRHVVFESGWKAVPEKTTSFRDIFVRDLELDRTVRISAPAGGEADNSSTLGYLGDRGRFVIFSSDATNLVPGDANGRTDVFRHDRDADGDGIYDEPGATLLTRVSVGQGDVEANNSAAFAITNCDGSVVSFWSTASNLVPGDTNGAADLFVRDVRTGTTTRISVEPRDGHEGNAESTWAKAISPDGRYVFFPSDASNLVPGDVNGARDYFVYDRGTSVSCWQGGGNEAPIAVDDLFEVEQGEELVFPAPGVLANDTDADGDLLEAELVEGPAHGVLSLLPTGAFAYTPAPAYDGEDTFTYVATDGADQSEPATVTIEVTQVNHAPVAVDSTLATDEDVPVEVAFEGSDPDDLPSDEPTELESEIISGPDHGTLADGVYTPDADWFGTDTVEFVLSDGELESESATLTIEVAPVNDAPSAADAEAATVEDTAVELPFAATDVDGDELTYELVEQPSYGSVEGGEYTPAANWHGVETVRFRASDGALADEAVVTVTVAPANDAPEAQDGAVATDEDTAVELPFAGIDVDGDELAYELVEPPAHGSVSGTTYTPAANWHGVETLRFRASDASLSDEAALSVTVRPVNDAPVVSLSPAGPVDEGGAAVALEAAATDVDGDALAYTWSTDAGTVAGDGATASFSAADGPGTARVRVVVSDGSASAVSETPVEVVNVAPTAEAGDAITGPWGVPLAFAGSATDPSPADTATLSGSWTFGDDTPPAAGPSATHAYATPGTYTATFTATDKDGAAGADTTPVTVERRATRLDYTGSVDGPSDGVPYGTAVIAARLVDLVDAPTAQAEGREVVFTVNAATHRATTDATGLARVDLATPLMPGTYTITARFEGDGLYVSAAAEATVTILGSAGKVTGGVLRTADGGRGGFTAQSDGEQVKGELEWIGAGVDFHARELSALVISPDGKRARFAGIATDGRRFEVAVEDDGKKDRFQLWLEGVLLTPDAVLTGGSIQIHRG